MPFRGGGDEEESISQLVEVVRGDLIISVSGSGSIGVANEAKLAFDGSGKVDTIYVDEGDVVKEGEALAVLAPVDTDALKLALAQAELNLAQAEASLAQADAGQEQAEAALEEAEYHLEQLQRYHATYEERRIARLQISVAELQVLAAEAQFKAAELQVDVAKQAAEEAASELEIETLNAPFYGVVTSVDVEEGDIIPNSGMSQVTIVHLIDPTSMELGVDLDEIDIPGVALDQRAIIEVDALPELQLEGRVTHVYPLPTVEAGVVLYKVKIGLDVPQGSGLKVGMSATADIIINERSSVLLVPDRAIRKDSHGNPIVWVMVGEQVEQRPVVVGISDGFQTEIIQGLNEGETVVMEMGAGAQPSTGPSGGPGFMPMMRGSNPAPPPER
jgi:macrolide-specific efflux system membrane fusion protein